MPRPLRRGDVIVADANVFNDFLSGLLGIARRDPKPSLRLMEAVRMCCARFGYTKPLLNQYKSSEPQARPILGSGFQEVANLVGRDKLFRGEVSAGACDIQDKQYQELPREDRFLLDVAAAVGALFIVTTDPGIPLGERTVSLLTRRPLEVEILTPDQLMERIEKE